MNVGEGSWWYLHSGMMEKAQLFLRFISNQLIFIYFYNYSVLVCSFRWTSQTLTLILLSPAPKGIAKDCWIMLD